MRESIFRFKQFSVINHNSAMKVGTDGVLIGAWCKVEMDNSILDVGAGTGLVSLMVAQRSSANIMGIEIDRDAANEANLNILNSPWKERLSILASDFVTFADNTQQKFDHIISNPPFFDNCIKSPNDKRALARHSSALPIELLLEKSAKLLNPNGKISIIIPSELEDRIKTIIPELGLNISRVTYVKPTPTLPIKRVLCELSLELIPDMQINTIVIEEGRHIYTNEYINLTKDYYLKM